MANNFRVADKYTLEKTIRKCDNRTDVSPGGWNVQFARLGEKEKIPQNRGHQKREKDVLSRRAESYIAIIEETCARSASEILLHEPVDTRRSHQSRKYPALQGQTTYSSRVADIFASRDLLNGGRSAPRVLSSVPARIEMRFNAMQIHRDAT